MIFVAAIKINMETKTRAITMAMNMKILNNFKANTNYLIPQLRNIHVRSNKPIVVYRKAVSSIYIYCCR